RLELEVADVGRNDRSAASHFVADEVGREPFTQRGEFHFLRDLAFARIMQLRDTGTAPVRWRRHAGAHPRFAQLRQAILHIVALRTAGVVDAQRRLAAGQRDLAHRYAHALRTVDIDFA